MCPGDNPGDDDDHDHDDGDDVGPAVLWMRVCPKIVKLKFAKSHHKHLVLVSNTSDNVKKSETLRNDLNMSSKDSVSLLKWMMKKAKAKAAMRMMKPKAALTILFVIE